MQQFSSTRSVDLLSSENDYIMALQLHGLDDHQQTPCFPGLSDTVLPAFLTI
jgi:hypothetical protein